MKKLFFCFLLFLLPSISFATQETFTSKINSIYPLASGNVIITFETPDENCQDSNGYFRVVDGQNGITKDGIKNILSAALTAGSTNNRVYVVYDPSTANCYINRLKIFFN